MACANKSQAGGQWGWKNPWNCRGNPGQQPMCPACSSSLVKQENNISIKRLSLRLWQTRRHPSSLPSLLPFFWYLFYKMGDKLAGFGFIFFASPGLVVCVLSPFCSYGAHPIKQLWKWSKKWVLLGVVGCLGGCEIVDFKEVSGNWN